MDAAIQTAGPQKLREWIDERQDRPGVAREKLGALIGCEARTIVSWLQGQRRPTLERAVKLQRATRGKVRVSDFFPELRGLTL